MKTSKKINYLDISKFLESNSITLESNIDKSEIFENINTLSNAKINDISFFSNIKYLEILKTCKAKACIIKSAYVKYLPENCQPIIVNDPYLAFANLIELFNYTNEISNGKISEIININKSAKLHQNIQIENFTNIKENTEIFENVFIGSNTSIGPNVTIKKNCKIHNNVSISNAIIEENCEIKPGARIGYAGFGFEEKTKKKIIHIGNVFIGRNCTIGSNTTIDRAVLETTSIGEYSQVDNLVQIAHNVVIGKHAIIASQVGIAGSTIIGDYVKIGGQAGISGHLLIGDNVTIAGKSGVTKNIQSNKIVAGFPAKDIKDWKREIISISKRK